MKKISVSELQSASLLFFHASPLPQTSDNKFNEIMMMMMILVMMMMMLMLLMMMMILMMMMMMMMMLTTTIVFFINVQEEEEMDKKWKKKMKNNKPNSSMMTTTMMMMEFDHCVANFLKRYSLAWYNYYQQLMFVVYDVRIFCSSRRRRMNDVPCCKNI